MPNAFARPCSFAGCKNTAPARFCPAHAQLVAKEFDRQRRSDPVRRLYFTSRWAHVRLSVLARLGREIPHRGLSTKYGKYLAAELRKHRAWAVVMRAEQGRGSGKSSRLPDLDEQEGNPS